MWTPETVGVKQPILSDKGSGRACAVRFWGQVVRITFGEPNVVVTYASVVSVPPTGNLIVLCLRFNLSVLSRKLGQPWLRLFARISIAFMCVVVHVTQEGYPIWYYGDTYVV